jgi:hypothetical protein
VETLELLNGQPDDVFIDRHPQLALQGPGNFARRGLSIALIPDQRGGAVEAMRLVSVRIVNKCFVIQFADHKIGRASTR